MSACFHIQSHVVKCLALKTLQARRFNAGRRQPIKTHWQTVRTRECRWGSIFPKRKVVWFDNNDAVKWDAAREQCDGPATSPAFNLFQIECLKNFYRLHNRRTPWIHGPLKYVCSRGEARVFGWVQSLPGKHAALQGTLWNIHTFYC